MVVGVWELLYNPHAIDDDIRPCSLEGRKEAHLAFNEYIRNNLLAQGWSEMVSTHLIAYRAPGFQLGVGREGSKEGRAQHSGRSEYEDPLFWMFYHLVILLF
jgi:hypothetical protein